jgi:hypothetical protein
MSDEQQYVLGAGSIAANLRLGVSFVITAFVLDMRAMNPGKLWQPSKKVTVGSVSNSITGFTIPWNEAPEKWGAEIEADIRSELKRR